MLQAKLLRNPTMNYLLMSAHSALEKHTYIMDKFVISPPHYKLIYLNETEVNEG